MVKLNESFKYDKWSLDIKFTPADEWGVDRHTIRISRPMCKSLRIQTFLKEAEDIRDFARSQACFVTTHCG